MNHELIKQLRELAAGWRLLALANVPKAYTSRNLERKYLNDDNQAAGMSECADDLDELIDQIGDAPSPDRTGASS